MGVSLGRNTNTYACTSIFVRTLIDIIHSTDSYPNRYHLTLSRALNLTLKLKLNPQTVVSSCEDQPKYPLCTLLSSVHIQKDALAYCSGLSCTFLQRILTVKLPSCSFLSLLKLNCSLIKLQNSFCSSGAEWSEWRCSLDSYLHL